MNSGIVRLLIVLMCLAVPLSAQKSQRDSAVALYDSGKHREALPLLEAAALVAQDRVLMESLGWVLIETAATLPDAPGRKAQRARGRAALAKAVELGSTSRVIKAIVDVMPVDGGDDAVYSSNKAVDEAMKTAEAAYGAQDWRKALQYYQEALQLDPTDYRAALFSGDVYIHIQPVDSAYVWYARATQINPYKETAYRYWSDVLTKNKQVDAAREKAIEAVVAEPYNRLSLQGLQQWAPVAKVVIGYPLLKFPVPTDTALMHSPAGLAYDSVRKAWKGSDAEGGGPFQAQFPKEAAYRHSMIEEKTALKAALKAAGDNPIFTNLKMLDEAGMIDCFVFFARPDAGIAKDYPEFQRANWEKLKKFWSEYVVGAKYVK